MPTEAYEVNLKFLVAENPQVNDPAKDLEKRIHDVVASLEPLGKVNLELKLSNLCVGEEVLGLSEFNVYTYEDVQERAGKTSSRW